MTEQIVEFKDDINFAFKLDELDYEKALVSPKQNIGHLLWSIRVFKHPPSKHSKRRFIRYYVQFERQADGNPVEFKLDAYLDSSVITKPERAPEHDYQYSWNCEPLRYDSSKSDEVSWHSECRWLSIDALKEPENEFLDKQGRVHLWARVDIFELSNYGRADKPDQLTVNNRTFKVNKYILAGYSPFFRTFFFKDGFKEFLTQNFQIHDPGVDADMFGKMLDLIMSPDQNDPDDETIEGLLQLADKYDISFVKEQCEKYLINYSAKPKIFKFRMAETYGLVELKGQALRRLDPQEFCANFRSNVDEFIKLGERSKRTWDQRMVAITTRRPWKKTRIESPQGQFSPQTRSPTRSMSTYTRSIRSMSRASSYQGSDSSSIYHPPTDASFSA